MAKNTYSFELKSDLSELDILCQNLEAFGQKFGLSQKLIFEINLALDELFTNIISYGFQDEKEHIVKVTLIPQDSDSPFEFTGRELVMMGRYPHVQRFRGARPEDHSAVQRALEMTDAASFADRSVYTLSGGEMRRISIARVLGHFSAP